MTVVISMSSLAARLSSRPSRHRPAMWSFVVEFVDAIAEGRRIAARYHELSRLSDAELRERGLTREGIARAVVLGGH